MKIAAAIAAAAIAFSSPAFAEDYGAPDPGQQFNFDPGYKPAPPPKPKPRRPARKPFDYSKRYISKAKIKRCMQELPWRAIMKGRDSPARRRELCQQHQIERWGDQDERRVQRQLDDIFGSRKQ